MPSINSSLADAITLKRCLVQKQAEQADFRNDREEASRLWGQVDALFWVIDLLDIGDNKTQYEFVQMTNNICNLYKKEGE